MSDYDVIQGRQSYTLREEFIEPFKSQRPDMSVPAYVIYLRTYSASVDGRMEEWWETCRRVIEGAFSFLKWHEVQNGLTLDWGTWDRWAGVMYTRMFAMKWVPAGRGIQHMGRDAVWVKGGALLNSCAWTNTSSLDEDFTEAFNFLMDMSMLGVGVGFGVEGAGKAKVRPPHIRKGVVHVVADTREGWLRVKDIILEAFCADLDEGVPEFFDFCDVRVEGTPLKTMGGLASGPGPLIRMVWDLFEVLVPNAWGYEVKEDGLRIQITGPDWGEFARNSAKYALSSLDIGDIMNIEGKCVVSGGIRRSAEIGIAPIEDWQFREGKSRKVGLSDAWIASHKARYGFAPETRNDAWRWAANNSHVIDESLTKARAREIAASVGEYGDPGLFNRKLCRTRGRLADGLDNRDFMGEGTNPCSEQFLEDKELCNLVETVPWRHDSLADFGVTTLCSLLYGKIVSLVPTHREDSNRVMRKNRRIGVSQTGVFRAIAKIGLAEYVRWCDETYKAMRNFDRTISAAFQVNESVRITSLKPSGTVSKIMDVESGLRAPEAPFYILRVQFDNTSPLIAPLRAAGYPVIQSVQSPQAQVVEFPVSSGCDRSVGDIDAETQLRLIELVQTYWSDNMVSNTVQFRESEKPDLARLIFEYGNKLKSLSFLCYDGHKYEQAPYEACSEAEYDRRVSSIKPIDFRALGAYGAMHDSDDKFCQGIACEVKFGGG